MGSLDDVESGQSHHHLLKRPPVDIEFSDLTYSVPQGPNGKKYFIFEKYQIYYPHCDVYTIIYKYLGNSF